MTITGVITAILIGIVVGALGRLLVPGRQPIGWIVTILVGIVSAFIGTAIARPWASPRQPQASTGSSFCARLSSPLSAWHWCRRSWVGGPA